MNSKSLQRLEDNTLVLKLRPLFVAQLSLVDSLSKGAFGHKDGELIRILKPEEGITPEFLRRYVKDYSSEVYIFEEDFAHLREELNQQLVRLSRSMSSGNPLKKGAKQAGLLSLQMANLYQDPFNDELLNNQFQNSKNFSSLLSHNKNIHKDIYNHIKRQPHHYTIKQPLLSSVLLQSFGQYSQLFTETEISNLFLASYFKDIGLSYIPKEKLESGDLSSSDKELFADHAENSMKLLKGRVQLTNNQLLLIEHHHLLNHLVQSKLKGENIKDANLPIRGLESSLMSSIDVLVAMTNKRPYRDEMSIFKALELLKRVVSEEHPQEFKLLVLFLKQFFIK